MKMKCLKCKFEHENEFELICHVWHDHSHSRMAILKNMGYTVTKIKDIRNSYSHVQDKKDKKDYFVCVACGYAKSVQNAAGKRISFNYSKAYKINKAE